MEEELRRKQLELTEVNRGQEPSAHLKTQFDSLRPDIALIRDNLVLIARIWTSVGAHILNQSSSLDPMNQIGLYPVCTVQRPSQGRA